MAGYLLDTHIWIWLQEADRDRLKRSALEQAEEWRDEGKLHISHISVWEVANLAEKGRVEISLPVDVWVQHGLDDPELTVHALTPPILVDSTRLPGVVHRDPADRMLIATARRHGLTLLTRDDDILTYAKGGSVRAKRF